MSPREEIEALAELALRHDLYVLADEAYWDIRYGSAPLSIAALPGMAERTVILYTFSKKFAMTGWRLGGAIGPEDVIKVIATLNVNEESCTNHFVQWAGVEALTGDQTGAAEIVATLQRRRDMAVKLLNDIPGVSCYSRAVYLFPDVPGPRSGSAGPDDFRLGALKRRHSSAPACTSPELDGETRRVRIYPVSMRTSREGVGRLRAWAEGS